MKLVSYFLILSFAAILAPRTLFHSHDSDHEQALFDETDGESNYDDECFACEIDLGTFTLPAQVIIRETICFEFKNNFRLNSHPNANHPSTLLLRGPPVELA